MFKTAPTQHYVSNVTAVAFKLTSNSQDLPDWFDRLVAKGRAKFDECGHMRVQVITGKFWVVEIGQVVMLKSNGDLYIMDELHFNQQYKEAKDA